LLFSSLQTYFAANDVYDSWTAAISDVVAFRAPSMGVARTVLVTDWFFGVPQDVEFKGVALEIERLLLQGVARDNSATKTSRFKRQAGRLGSALASLVLEQGFSETPGISALRALAAALDVGQRIYTLDSETASAILPTLGLSDEASELISRLLLADWQVTVPAGSVTLESWNGLGTGGTDVLTGKTTFPTFGNAGLATGVIYGDVGRVLGWGSFVPMNLSGFSQQMEAVAQGLIPLVSDPFSIEVTESVLRLIAGSLIDLETGSSLPTVLDEHLFSGLLLDSLSLGQLLDPDSPVVSVEIASTTLVPGEYVSITVVASDDGDLSSVSLTVNDSALPLDVNGVATFTATVPGSYTVVATAVDGAGNIGRDSALIRVTAPNDADAPVLVIHSPAENAEITAPTDFVATVQDENLVGWKLTMQSVSQYGQTVIASGNSVAENEVIATFDPTLLVNGIYRVVFEAEDANGEISQVSRVYSVSGDLKVGICKVVSI